MQYSPLESYNISCKSYIFFRHFLPEKDIKLLPGVSIASCSDTPYQREQVPWFYQLLNGSKLLFGDLLALNADTALNACIVWFTTFASKTFLFYGVVKE